MIGMPRPSSMNKKFLLAYDTKKIENLVPPEFKCEIFHVEENFIKCSVKGHTSMLCKIGKNESFTYSHHVKFI